jgi:hypothetical protein
MTTQTSKPQEVLKVIARLIKCARRYSVKSSVSVPALEDARTVDDARKAIRQNGKLGSHARQQENRRDCELDDVTDVADLDIHEFLCRPKSGMLNTRRKIPQTR